MTTQITVAVKKDYTNTVNRLIQQFEKENQQIKVKLLQLPDLSDDMHRILVTDFSAGQNEFDICEIEDIWLDEFASRGYIIDLTDHLSFDEEQYIKIVSDGILYDNKIYMIPFEMDLGMMYFRKDIVPNSYTGFDNILNYSQPLPDNVQLFTIQGQDGEDMICNMLELIKYTGGVEDGLRLYKKLISIAGKSVDSENDYVSVFKSGNAIFMRSWITNRTFLNDDLSKVRNVTSISPLFGDIDNPVGIAKRYGLAINTGSSQKPEVLKFLSYCMREDVQFNIVKEKGSFPMLKRFYDDEMVMDACPYLADMKDLMDKIQTRRKMKNYTQLSMVAQREFKAYLSNDLNLNTASEAVLSLLH